MFTTHHKQRALSFRLLRRLGQPALIQLDKEPLAAQEGDTRGRGTHSEMNGGQKWWLGVIANNCIHATANRNRIKIRNGVKNVERSTACAGEKASKSELQNWSCLRGEDEEGEKTGSGAGAEADGEKGDENTDQA